MAIRITNAETEQLIRDMAELHQISPSQAVHQAVDQWFSESDLTSAEGNLVKKVMAQRVLIGYLEGQDEQARRISDDSKWMIALAMLILIVGFTFSKSAGALFTTAGLLLISLWALRRKLNKETEGRLKYRRDMENQIAGIRHKLPAQLEFLLDGPVFDDFPSLEEQNDEG